MQALKNIIVTGSNKGIGYGIVNHLASQSGWNIIIAVRNINLGEQAKEQLQKKYPQASLQLQKLDVSEPASIDQFVNVVKQKYGVIHTLVNNAGIAAKGDAFDTQVVRFTFQTNFYGTIQLIEKILPFIADGGRIVTVGSTAGVMTFKRITNESLKQRFRNPNLTKQELYQLLQQFADAVGKNTYTQQGWPKWSYGVSKLGINLYMNLLGRQQTVNSRKIQVYGCCPGYVKTDMTSQKGSLSVEEGILTPVYLIEQPFEFNPEHQGSFYYLQKPISLFE